MRRGELLANGVLSSLTLIARFYPGFTDANRTTQAPSLPNHFAWNLGHLAITMLRVAEKLDGRPLPDESFVTGPNGDSHRFGTESVSFASVPTDEPARYPGQARCIEILTQAGDRLAAALRAADDGALDAATPWGKATTTPGDLGLRMVFHNGVHCGQIVDLRRALTLGNVLG